MLRPKIFRMLRNQAGDTLIEVTIGLTILGVVLLGATTVATLALRMGQTAQDRTLVAEAAQEQMEALRSYRDNNTWAVFEAGINSMPVNGGFHMQLTTGATTQWAPVANSLAAAASSTFDVPGATINITTSTPVALRGCGFDLLLVYSFIPPGSDIPDTNRIQTRLANLKYSGAAAQCP